MSLSPINLFFLSITSVTSSSTQENTSSNSLGRIPVKENFLNNLSTGRLRGETLTSRVPNTPSPMSNNLIPTSASRQLANKTNSPSSSYDSLDFISARKASTHPYANPELIVSHPEGVQNPPGTPHTATHFDSAVPEPFPMLKFNALARISIPDSSVNHVGSKVRTSPIRTRNISSPVAAICSPQNLRPSAERLQGWTERPSAAAFSLISLEEARAKRMRTSTDTGATTLSFSDSGTSFPPNSADYSTSSPSSPLANLGSRARGRSISAGANAKNALHNFLGQQKFGSDPVLKEDFIPAPPPGKSLKNKKSGFLRIFNREKELQSVPPVPSIPDGISQFQPSQRLAAASMHRVPVPSLSQPEFSTSENDGSSLPVDNLSTDVKQTSPSLFVNTTSQGSPARATTSNMSTLGLPAGLQSAPPEIPILKLRPVSMVFSASFGDLVPSGLSETAGQETPRSCTPPTSRYLNDTVVNDENHPAAKALQEQMMSTKNTWQRHISELEGQVRGLKAELEQLKNNDEYCDKCGRGKKSPQGSRTRTGSSSRFVNHRT